MKKLILIVIVAIVLVVILVKWILGLIIGLIFSKWFLILAGIVGVYYLGKKFIW